MPKFQVAVTINISGTAQFVLEVDSPTDKLAVVDAINHWWLRGLPDDAVVKIDRVDYDRGMLVSSLTLPQQLELEPAAYNNNWVKGVHAAEVVSQSQVSDFLPTSKSVLLWQVDTGTVA